MTTTDSSDVFVPEVYADMAQAKFTGLVKVAGSPAVIEDNTLQGNPGDTVTFPKWGALGELDDLTEGTAMTPAALSTSSATATIKEAGKAVEITSRAKLVELGSADSEVIRQFGILAARKVDADLITQAQADETSQGGGNPLKVTAGTGNTTLTYDRVLQGVTLFGDEWQPDDFAGIYINSAQFVEAMADTTFISADKVGAAGLPVARGMVASVLGIPVYITDRVAAKKVLFVKKGALGLLYKQRPIVERDRDILKRTDVITTNLHYACKRLDDRGVGVVTLAAS